MLRSIQTPAHTISITKRKIKTLVHDNIKTAEAISLVYVNNKQKGIRRIKKGKSFIYQMDDQRIADTETLSRIQSLVIPPAWEQVWICSLPNGHLQATGIDTNGRRQYRYHPLWNAMRSETKFFNLYDFGKALPAIRERITADLSLPGMPLQKVLAAIVSLMEYTGMRIGNNFYEKLYGSFGLTTLHDKHINISGSEMRFSFKGKKGVQQDIKLKSKKLAKIVQQCKDIPGKELFQYYDENGCRKPVDSGMVNAYIKEIAGNTFSSKHFRTWLGTLFALEVFIEQGDCDTITATKKTVVETLDVVAARLGNTRTVCKKYYVHPAVIDHYSNNTIEKFIIMATQHSDYGQLRPEEQVLMKMLEKVEKVVVAV